MTAADIIPDEEIAAHHFGRFGPGSDPRHVLDEGVLKSAFGYANGSTVCAILRRHGLTNANHCLTKKGKMYLRALFAGVSLERVLAFARGASDG